MPVSVRVYSHETQSAMRELARRNDRATMYVLRDAGRKVKQYARAAAPVYGGGGKRVRKDTDVNGTSNAPQPGLLRISIKSGKRLVRYGMHGFGVRVAPRGQRVHLYSGDAESRHHFMAQAYDRIESEFDEIAARAWARGMKR